MNSIIALDVVVTLTAKNRSHRDNSKLASSERIVDFYHLLAVPKDASLTDIKAAYHRALLRSHPDKQANANGRSSDLVQADITSIQKAYKVLSDSQLRAAHDAQLAQQFRTVGPRPAEVISLEEFEDEGTVQDAGEGPWRYRCRCGGWYRINIALMDNGEHLVFCSSCSEAVWVGYEALE